MAIGDQPIPSDPDARMAAWMRSIEERLDRLENPRPETDDDADA